MKNSFPKHKRNSSYPIRGGMLGLLLVLAACSPSEPESQGTEPRVRLVTSDQYLNSLRYILGSGIELQVEFPPRPHEFEDSDWDFKLHCVNILFAWLRRER